MIKAAKIVLINPEKKILLYLRDNKRSIPHPNYWDLFGGKTEKNESYLQSVIREVKEEIIDYSPRNIKKIGCLTLSKDKDGIEAIVHIFSGSIDIPIQKVIITEGQKAKYFSIKDLEKIKFAPYYKEFIFKNLDKFGL